MAGQVYIPGAAGRFPNYEAAVRKAGGVPCFGGAPERCGCLLLPGGGDLEPWRYGQMNTASRGLEPERDALEMRLLAYFTVAGKPVLGICRGMQSINVFFGGDLVQDWPGHSGVDGHDRLHVVETAPSFLRAFCGERCLVNSSHHQVVGRLGEGLEALQWAEDGAVEAIGHRRLPAWGVQWHPERLPREMDAVAGGAALLRAFVKLGGG